MRTSRVWLAAIGVAALVSAGCSSGGNAGSKPSGGHDPNLTEAATDSLFRGLTADVARHNGPAFLAKFTGSAKASATRWWQNMTALGFTNGLFYPESIVSARVPLN